MKTLILAGTSVLAMAVMAGPGTADARFDNGGLSLTSDAITGEVVIARQGRSGTGERGRDRDRSSDDRGRHDSGDDNGRHRGGDDSGSGRDRPRVPGGSGCDSARDIAEHPECQV